MPGTPLMARSNGVATVLDITSALAPSVSGGYRYRWGYDIGKLSDGQCQDRQHAQADDNDGDYS